MQRGTHPFLVFVNRGGIDGAIADFQRFGDGLRGFFNAGLPYAESQLRHQITIVEFDDGLHALSPYDCFQAKACLHEF
ncbi:hypothetical protein D3C76_1694770 [compost metagenome]